jgi:hypothetical protein
MYDMARFNVKYKVVNKKTKTAGGTMTVIVNATSLWEARQLFKYNHVDTDSTSYKIIAAIKTGK